MGALRELKLHQEIVFGRTTIVLSVLVLASAFFTIRAETTDHQNQVYFFKVVTMLFVLAIAWLAFDPPSLIYKRLIVAGLAISMVGDILLMAPSDLFLPGLVAFLIAQIVYTIGFVKIGGFYRSVWGALPFIAFGIIVLIVLGPNLDDMFVPVLFYLIAILVMVWQALGQWRQTGERRALFAFIGALFFVASDTALAFNRFDAPIAQASLIVLGTYFFAQWLIALSAGSQHP